MRAAGVGTLVAVILGLATAVTAWRHTMLARSHRDVGGVALGLAATAGLLAATASFVAVPGAWASLYRLLIGVYQGGS